MNFDERRQTFNNDFLDSLEREKCPIRGNWVILVRKRREQERAKARQKRKSKPFQRKNIF